LGDARGGDEPTVGGDAGVHEVGGVVCELAALATGSGDGEELKAVFRGVELVDSGAARAYGLGQRERKRRSLFCFPEIS